MIRNIVKFVLVSSLAATVVGCASMDDRSPEAFKNVPQHELYAEGRKALLEGKYTSAARRFEAVETLYPFGVDAEKSQLDLIYTYYQMDDPASALATTDRYIRLYPRGKNVDYAYYMKGLINMERTQSWIQRIARVNPADRELEPMQDAFNAFNQLVRFFPKSIYREDARQRMIYIRGLLAQKELDIARYYLKRKLYVASANRASYVFNHFQGTQQALEAMGVMAQAYQHLGEEDMAAEVIETLRMNYPDSEVYKNLQRA